MQIFKTKDSAAEDLGFQYHSFVIWSLDYLEILQRADRSASRELTRAKRNRSP
ncbi:UNVERIFIED_CONTAM: hypothetical protein FKN15_033369 [Acipenser sinensis]